MVMNKALQIHVIEDKLRDEGITDFDVEAHVDSDLSLPENIENLKQKGYINRDGPDRPSEVKDRIIQTQIQQAVEMMKEERTKAELSSDWGKTARDTFKPPLTEREFNLWLRRPNEYDIEGVDTAEDVKTVELDFQL